MATFSTQFDKQPTGKSAVTDEPNNPIDDACEPLDSGASDPDVRDAVAGLPADGVEQPSLDSADRPTEAEDMPTPVETSETPASAEPDSAEPVSEPAAKPAKSVASAKARVKAAKPDKAASKPDKAEPKPDKAEPKPDKAEPKSDSMDWYILKIQSNREESIREGLVRRVAIAGLDYYFGDIIVPTEKVTEFKGGKKRVTKRKLYPGYLVVHMEINDDTWFLVRETPGIGDFTGAAGHPTPMLPHEVARIVAKQEEKHDEAPKLKIAFNTGDHIKITEGTFENFEGEVHSIDEANGRVTVMINIFGRSTPVELEYWQIESV
jgi:transcription termination/antitermination protein NusG